MQNRNIVMIASATPHLIDDGLIMKHLGDLLLTFGIERTPYSGRTAEVWSKENDGQGWRLWTQQESDNWRGFPLTTGVVGRWHIWLLGDMNNESPVQTIHSFFNGDMNPVALNGHFLLLAFDTLVRHWHIWTNRFGTVHAYYADNGRIRSLGTFSPAVAETVSSRKLDWAGLAGFFGFGFFPADRTYFEDVHILRPAHHYVLDVNGQILDEKRYWQWWHQPDHQRSYQETVEEFGTVFNKVMDGFYDGGRIAIPISGGLDSRSTVATLQKIADEPTRRSQFWSYSYGYSQDSVETDIASQIAQVRSLPFQAFTIQPYLFDKIGEIVACTEGFQDITQCRQVTVLNEIRNHADYLIAALWGDVWLDDMGLLSEKGKTYDKGSVITHAYYKILKRGRSWLLENVVRPQVAGENLDALLHSSVTDEMVALQHIDDLDFRLKAYKTEQWSFRWSLPPLRVFQAAAWPRPVFYDTRLSDFFCTVPTQFLHGRRLQIDYLKRFAPDLAQVTWQAYDTNLYLYQHFHTWLLPKRILKKMWRVLTRKQVIERNWEVQFLHAKGRQELESWLLRSGLHLHEFVPITTIHTLLNAFYADPMADNRGYTVSMLLSFSAWLETYA